MHIRTLLRLLLVLPAILIGFSCASNSGVGRAPLLSRRLPSVIQLSPVDSSFNHHVEFSLQRDVPFMDDSGRTITGSLAKDTSSLASGYMLVSTMLPSGRGYLDELPIRSEHRFSMARVGTSWVGKLSLYTIQRIDSVAGKPSVVGNEMRSILLLDELGDTYILDFLPGCKFELLDVDSDHNGDFLRAGENTEYSISGYSAKQIAFYLLGRPAIARILHVEYIKRTR